MKILYGPNKGLRCDIGFLRKKGKIEFYYALENSNRTMLLANKIYISAVMEFMRYEAAGQKILPLSQMSYILETLKL